MLRTVVRGVPPRDRTDELLMAIGALEAHLLDVRKPKSLRAAEFKVFSQFGEDGIIQYLLRHVPISETTFVEIGVESYRESNTRFLAMNDNWRGLIIDGSDDHLRFVAESDINWRVDVRAVQAFVTRENVNDLLRDAGFSGDLGLLSIDVDGADYWIWEAIEIVSPAIVVIEFNSIFGPSLPVTVPYDPGFVCSDAHWSGQYFGASLSALDHLAGQRGYQLIGVSSNAVNAFFVRRDVAGDLSALEANDAWLPSRFLSSRDEAGRLSHVREHVDRLRLIRHLALEDVRTGERATVAELYGV
jgi:hypothetical protein